MSSDDLLKMAASYDALVEPAQAALRAEFARRNLEPPLVEDGSSGQLISERRVTIRSYPDVSQAMVPKSVLESAGIFSFLQDENLVRVDWGAGIAVGGVRLQVRPEDAKEADALLSQPMPESIEYGVGGNYLQPRCPLCGSIDVGTPRLYDPPASALPGEQVWQCDACGCRWPDDGEEAFG